MTYDYVIIGGGCYGSYYVRQLVAARERGKITWNRVAVLDRDPSCAVAELAYDDVDVVNAEWTEFGTVAFADPARWMSGQLVPAPIAPHVLMHWIRGALAADYEVTQESWSSDVPGDLPFAQVAPNGALVMSWAPGLCPTNCIEPRKCPLTKQTRDWEMSDTAAEQGPIAGLGLVETFVCRHHAYGVGTIDFGAVVAANRKIRAAVEASGALAVGIATVSACHGLMDVLRVARRSRET